MVWTTLSGAPFIPLGDRPMPTNSIFYPWSLRILRPSNIHPLHQGPAHPLEEVPDGKGTLEIYSCRWSRTRQLDWNSSWISLFLLFTVSTSDPQESQVVAHSALKMLPEDLFFCKRVLLRLLLSGSFFLLLLPRSNLTGLRTRHDWQIREDLLLGVGSVSLMLVFVLLGTRSLVAQLIMIHGLVGN